MGLLGMKICVFFLIQLLPFIVKVGDWALQWTEGNAAVQIFFVMLLFPVIMNAIQYYIIDIFIKKPISPYAAADSNGDIATNDDAHHREALLDALDESYSTDSDDQTPGKPRNIPPKAINDLHESEHLFPEDQSPVPPYESSSSSNSPDEHDTKPRSTRH